MTVVEPWNQGQADALAQRKAGQFWLLLDEEEIAAVAAGTLPARVQAVCRDVQAEPARKEVNR